MSDSQKPIPQKMAATCTNCGKRHTGGMVTTWLKREDGELLSEVKDDVSFKCVFGCEEVHEMEVEILEP